MAFNEIEAQVIQCLRKVINNVSFERESPLLELGIDSMTFIRLVVEIEEQFDIEVAEEDIVLDNFGYIENITKLVSGYMSSESGH